MQFSEFDLDGKVLSAIDGFMDPFNPPPEHNPDLLYRISSGKPVPKEVEEDVFRADPAGIKLKQTFVKERLNPATKTKRFYDPVKKLKLKSMGDVEAQSRVAKDKTITYAEQSDFAIQAIAKATSLEKPISLEELMSYSITSVPSALGTPDGFFCKTNKATIVHHLSDEYLARRPPEDEVFHIEDGNAVFHSMTNVPDTFKGIALKLLDQSSYKKSYIFSTDSSPREFP